MSIKPIFWLSVDDSILDFVTINKPLIQISEKYPFFALCSGKYSPDIIKKFYHNATVIKSPNNRPIKGMIFYEHIKRKKHYNIIIRLCHDALIMNTKKLFKRVDDGINAGYQVMGNIVTKKRKYDNKWVRGACSAVTGKAARAIKLRATDRMRSFDKCFGRAVVDAGIEFSSHPLFELGYEYTGEYPVWHPPQRITTEGKLLLFKQHLDKIEQCK